MMKYLLWLTLVIITMGGCKDDDDDEQNQNPVCACLNDYVVFHTSSNSVCIPNIFTPNGDIVNEVFGPLTLGVINGISIIIKDGVDTVYSSTSSSWDGTVNGSPLTVGKNFHYIIEVTLEDGVKKQFENTITVIPDTSSCPDSLSNCVFATQYAGGWFNPTLDPRDLGWCY